MTPCESDGNEGGRERGRRKEGSMSIHEDASDQEASRREDDDGTKASEERTRRGRRDATHQPSPSASLDGSGLSVENGLQIYQSVKHKRKSAPCSAKNESEEGRGRTSDASELLLNRLGQRSSLGELGGSGRSEVSPKERMVDVTWRRRKRRKRESGRRQRRDGGAGRERGELTSSVKLKSRLESDLSLDVSFGESGSERLLGGVEAVDVRLVMLQE